MLAFVAGAASSSKWQQDASDVSDPSDWVGGSFAFLKDLDASLRCEICSVSGKCIFVLLTFHLAAPRAFFALL